MNIRMIEGQGADPEREARDLLARQAALAALDTLEAPDALETVGYRSAGNTLVVGSRCSGARSMPSWWSAAAPMPCRSPTAWRRPFR